MEQSARLAKRVLNLEKINHDLVREIEQERGRAFEYEAELCTKGITVDSQVKSDFFKKEKETHPLKGKSPQ